MDPKAQEKFLEQVQNDLKNLSLESKRLKSLQSLREATEEAIVKVRSLSAAAAQGSHNASGLYVLSNQILYPLVQGCESKDVKVVKLSLGLVQRLIVHKALDSKGARNVADTLWMLMEAAIEEVKILQTVTLLLTSSHVARHETLAKCLVICFRLCFTKDATTNTIAGATVRQLVPAVFERVVAPERDAAAGGPPSQEMSPQLSQLVSQMLPKGIHPLVVDAYLMFQDIVLLVNADNPKWMTGIVEMTRSFGLELLESILRKFPELFAKHEPFKLLLKERVCSLVIKLFSPNIKYRAGFAGVGGTGGGSLASQERPYFPITSKLLRVVSILILEYHKLLTTETEIFLSLVMKFLDPDKPMWQNSMALEVLHQIAVKPDLLVFICTTFDQNSLSTKVFQDMVNGLGAYVQNVMMSPSTEGEQGQGGQSSAPPSSSSSNSGQSSSGTGGQTGGMSPLPGFYYRNVWKPLTISFIGGQTKELFLDVSDRSEVPPVSDGYGVSLAYACLLDVVRSMSLVINRGSGQAGDSDAKTTHRQLVDSSWCGILAALSLLLDASTDDASTENILKAFETYASLCGMLELQKPRDAFLASLCKASLPPHYTLDVLKATPCTQTVSGPKVQHPVGAGSAGQAESGSSDAFSSGEADIRHQVVAVGMV